MAVNIREVKEAGISQRAVDYIYNVIDPEQKKSVIEDEAFKDTINAIKATDSVPKNAIEITRADNNSISQIENGKGKTFVLRGNLNFGRTLNIPSDTTIYVDGTITRNGNHSADFYDDENTGNSVDAVFRVDDKSNVKLIGVNNAKLRSNQRGTGVYIEGSDNVEVRGFDIGNVWEGVVSHWGNNNVKILNNYIHDTGKRAIWSLGSKGTQAAHNFIENAGGDGFDWDAYSTGSLAYENVVVGWRRWAGFVEEGAQNSYFAKNIGIMAEFEYKHPDPNKIPDKGYTMGWADNGTTAKISRLTQNNYFIGNSMFKPSSYNRKASGGGYFAKRNQQGKGQTYFWGNTGNVGFANNGSGNIPDANENPKDTWYKANIESTVAPGQSTLNKFEALFPVSGNVPGNNGGQNPTNPKPPTGSNPMVIQAEDMQLGGEYRVEKIGAASGGEVISLRGGNNNDTGTASFNFTGGKGIYNVKINYFDENDGIGQLKLKKGNQQLTSFKLDKQLGSPAANQQTMTSMEIKNVSISSGDRFQLEGVEQGSPQTAEHARVDSVEFIRTATNPKPLKPMFVEAEDMQLGGEYRVEKIGAASGGEVISLRGGDNNGTGTANFDFTGSTGTYDLKINYFDENDGVGQLKIDQGSDRLISFQLNKQLGSSLANEQTMTSMEISDIFVSKGDNFRIEGIEQGLPNTAEHVRIDSIQFIPTDSSSTLI